MLVGIDTSFYKRDINLAALARCDFVYTKATEGTYYVDPSCDPIVEQAKATGKKWGVYHFAANIETDPISEANFFVNNCLGYVGAGMLILDYEAARTSQGVLYNDPHNVVWAKQWLDQVYALTGVRPLIYMSYSVTKEADWSSVIAAGYGLICAAYMDNYDRIDNYAMDPARDPSPTWDGTVGDVMWQFTSSGYIDGYGGNLDCNFFYGTRETWDAYAGVVATTPPTPTPAPTPVVTTSELTEKKAVPYLSSKREDATLPKGTEKVLQAGVNGEETIVYQITYTDGVETSRTTTSDVITTAPVDEVISVGTYVVPDTPAPTQPAKTLGEVIKALWNYIVNFLKRKGKK